MEYKDKNGISRNEKILDLYNKMNKKELILKPSFQRNLVWNNKHKEAFINTILLGYPFPEVYFANGEIDFDTMMTQTVVVDGQQRLDTIYKYITDDDSLILKSVPRYSKLKKREKERFLEYNVVIRDLGNASEDEIKEIFKRINSVGYALNAVEINNALYDGEYINLAKELLDDCVLYKYGVFSNNDSVRMKDLEYMITIISTVEVGTYFTSTKENESFIKQYDDEYRNKNTMKSIINEAFNVIDYVEFSKNSMWLNKTCMFTLICELAFAIKQGKTINKSKCKTMLIELEESIRKSKEGDYEYIFTNYMIQATGSKLGRKKRGEVIRPQIELCCK